MQQPEKPDQSAQYHAMKLSCELGHLSNLFADLWGDLESEDYELSYIQAKCTGFAALLGQTQSRSDHLYGLLPEPLSDADRRDLALASAANARKPGR